MQIYEAMGILKDRNKYSTISTELPLISMKKAP